VSGERHCQQAGDGKCADNSHFHGFPHRCAVALVERLPCKLPWAYDFRVITKKYINAVAKVSCLF
jgi:hypothetical protein